MAKPEFQMRIRPERTELEVWSSRIILSQENVQEPQVIFGLFCDTYVSKPAL